MNQGLALGSGEVALNMGDYDNSEWHPSRQTTGEVALNMGDYDNGHPLVIAVGPGEVALNMGDYDNRPYASCCNQNVAQCSRGEVALNMGDYDNAAWIGLPQSQG